MPSIKDKPLKASRLHFCQEYDKNGHNGADAYRVAYPKCNSGHKQCAANLLTFIDVKQEIARLSVKTVERLEITRELQETRLNTLYDMAVSQKNVQAARAVCHELNEMKGLIRELAPNPLAMAGIRARMSAEEELSRLARAKERTKALSESKPAFPRINKETA